MRVLFFGAGGLADAFAKRVDASQYRYPVTSVEQLGKRQCDVRDYHEVLDRIDRHRPDFIINTAGLSDRMIGVSMREVVDTNLIGAINVSIAAHAFGTPCLLVASTAGMEAPKQHPWYGPAKAGVIAHVAAMGKAGHQIYCLSPNRMDTKMREDDWPGEDPRTRLVPFRDVVPVMYAIIEGKYSPGANVVVRKVGLDRVDVFEAPTVSMPGRL